MSNVTPLTGLLRAMEPRPPLDSFDMLALDIIGEAQTLPVKQARELIAARLRLAHSQGRLAGMKELEQTVSEALA